MREKGGEVKTSLEVNEMQKKVAPHQIEVDYKKADIKPKLICEWVPSKANALTHFTSVTIGEPAHKPTTKGSGAKYSRQDAILMRFGKHLLELGLAPHRVRSLINDVRNEWDDKLVPILNKDRTWETDNWMLIGEQKKSGTDQIFEARFVQKTDLLGALGERGPGYLYEYPIPRIVESISAFVGMAAKLLDDFLRTRAL